MTIYALKGKGKLKTILFLCILFLLYLSRASGESGDFYIKTPKGFSGYAENFFEVYVPESGKLVLEIRDERNTYRVLSYSVREGENLLPWDGLGWNEERLNKKTYTVYGFLTGASGAKGQTQVNMYLETSSQALLYALPSSPTLYTDHPEDWFLEFRMIMNDDLIIEVFPEKGSEEPLMILKRNFIGGRVSTCTWENLSRGAETAPGSYHLCAFAAGNPRYRREFDLTVIQGSRPETAIGITGSIMPEETDTDEEIWDKMMLPSVVVDINPTSHQNVYAEKNEKSASLGTLHGQTQSLEVLEISGEWALIHAWNHESASPVTGWVPVSVLKYEDPAREYALLLNKKEQTLTLFKNGKRVDTILVSTGRAEKNELYQETAAGSFLTDLHRADFSTNGLKYDFVIRYDGGNLLHQIPYAWGEGKKDYLAGSVYLGAKASHACVRIQAEPGENGINAYWLWTHLPYHTRVIILDDPEEREGFAKILEGKTQELDNRLNGWSVMPEAEEDPEDSIVLTFGGDAVLGGRETYYGREDAFPYYIEKNGMEYPFSALAQIFGRDDLTSVNLECVLKNDAAGEDKTKNWRFRGLTSYADILKAGSVELVNLANNHTIDYGDAGRTSTLSALKDKAAFCGNGQNTVINIRGHAFGFGGCRETTYLKDPELIDRDIREMREKGAEYIIYQCHWGKEYSGNHNALQEAMARRCKRAGADLVIGHHPHVVQGIDIIGDMPVVYSLGNLVFGGTVNLKTWDGLLVQAVFYPKEEKRSTALRLIPILTSSSSADRINDYRPVPAGNDDWLRILRAVQADTPFSLTDRVMLSEP